MSAFFCIFAACVLTSGCFQWTEDSAGTLQSVGLPGVPVWKNPDPNIIIPPRTAVASVAPLDPAAADLTDDGSKKGVWLVELNKWREIAGLAAVGENADLSKGCENHARYLVENGPQDPAAFAEYAVTVDSGAHTEDRGRRWYTIAGAEAAEGGKPVDGVARAADVVFGANEFDDVMAWLVPPFHRFALLAPWAQIAGYGSFRVDQRRSATVVVRGRAIGAVPNVPIMFPPDETTFPSGAMTLPEWPNSLTSCRGYEMPSGLPITLQTGQPFRIKSASIRDMTSGTKIDSCAFDGSTYTNPDAVAQGHGRDLLNFNGAVIVIPRHPLTPGHRYGVEIKTRRKDFTWIFAIGQRHKTYTVSASR